jgi:hypothetical protein
MLLRNEQTQKCTYQPTRVTNSEWPYKFTYSDVTVQTNRYNLHNAYGYGHSNHMRYKEPKSVHSTHLTPLLGPQITQIFNTWTEGNMDEL